MANMYDSSRRGPKSKHWTKAAGTAFDEFFAQRSGPLSQPQSDVLVDATQAGLSWLYSSFGEDPTQVQAAEGAPVRNTVVGITGTLMAVGFGQDAGIGTCHHYWVVDDVEVPESTARAVRRVRGGTGDLQLRLADGSFRW